ncbi:hypothetical protein RJ639_005784 [Escallonia herrerae]|uniref:Lipoxygenase n=1 Tax=Escallonia herrerae TaxID=1293975 RepID=A0AA89ASS7_9ASTE|nr:hypothetical protein RJ639_005784 [Escallonia herrerae]
MLKSGVPQSLSRQTLFSWQKPFVSAGEGRSFPFFGLQKQAFRTKRNTFHVCCSPNNVRAIAKTPASEETRVKAVVAVQVTVGGFLSNLGLTRGLDDITDLLGKSIILEFVAAELDPKTGLEKENLKGYVKRTKQDENEVKYEFDFAVPDEFGEIGAVFVENEHHKEIYLKNITLDGFPNGTINVTCNSWVHPKSDNQEKRVFFTNKSYLPFQTPSGLKKLREKELAVLRGDGEGERKTPERIYDYDVYNDLGDPNSSSELARPVLGGKDYPYPRRNRTGRPKTKKDPLSESRSTTVYVPRDEAFSEVKSLTFSAKTVYSVLHALVPALEGSILDREAGFPYFTAIDSLFNEGVDIPVKTKGTLGNILPRLVDAISDAEKDVLCFEIPEMFERDKFSWFRDEEFSRQTLAGLNPCSIKLVTEWPLKSKLDPNVYGPPESAITKELVELEIRGFMTLEEALEQKKLFMLDYHDLLLPFVNKVREIKGTTLYGSRTLFFLTPVGTLRPLAIELTRPPSSGKAQWKQVFRPCWDATGAWLWKLAKAHVLAHDSGYHQLAKNSLCHGALHNSD